MNTFKFKRRIRKEEENVKSHRQRCTRATSKRKARNDNVKDIFSLSLFNYFSLPFEKKKPFLEFIIHGLISFKKEVFNLYGLPRRLKKNRIILK